MPPPTPHFKLHQDPLTLVLCQMRFSRIRKMRDFLPEIQDRLRKVGFPEDASTGLQRIRLEPGKPPAVTATRHEEFRTKDGTWGVVIAEDMVALTTTHYDRFREFSARFRSVLEVMDQVASLHEGSVFRVGIRYVDVIAPKAGEGWREYLRPSFHGPDSPVFKAGQPSIGMEFHGETTCGRMTVRITQNSDNVLVPPDSMVTPMKFRRAYPDHQPLTLIDTDHYLEGSWDFRAEDILETLDELHKGSNSLFFEGLITEHALVAWGAERVADAQA